MPRNRRLLAPELRSSGARRLPVELYTAIAELLPEADLYHFMQCCKVFHDIGASMVYSQVFVEHENIERFAIFLERLQPRAAGHIRYPPVYCIRKLMYVATTYDDDLRYLPILTEVLRHARELRVLELSISSASEGMLIALWKRYGIIRTNVSAVQAAYQCAGSGRKKKAVMSPWTLPRLTAFQCSSARVVKELSSFRSLRAIDVHGELTSKEVVQLLDGLAANTVCATVEAFTCSSPPEDVGPLVSAVAATFPALTFMGIDIDADEPYEGLSALNALGTLSVDWCMCLCDETDWGEDVIQKWLEVPEDYRPCFKRVLFACGEFHRIEDVRRQMANAVMVQRGWLADRVKGSGERVARTPTGN
ncbi:hypothetical protein OH77DRAFT_1514993 [Trametes cingulata]|nr:hypothetical protein OH77DRAFT_1514993 [Trametes cingulata]